MYIVILYQENGCDYTIGCGVVVKQLKASSIEGAENEVADILISYGGEVDSYRIMEISHDYGLFPAMNLVKFH